MGSFCYSVGIASYSNERCLVPRSDARGKGIIACAPLPHTLPFPAGVPYLRSILWAEVGLRPNSRVAPSHTTRVRSQLLASRKN